MRPDMKKERETLPTNIWRLFHLCGIGGAGIQQ